MRRDMKPLRHLLAIVALVCMAFSASAQDAEPKPKGVQFAWGASFTGQVDMTGHDMSTVGMDAYFGMKTAAIEIIGLGAGLNVPVSNSHRMLPIYAVVRTNFSTRPTLCFLDLRGGLSVNDYADDHTSTGAYMSGGVGINLAAGRNFTSHIIVGMAYYDRKKYTVNDKEVHPGSLGMAVLRLGISF